MFDWLDENSCEMVAMESTGSYWKPVYNILEANDMPVMVVNAQHMKNVPGRKTDVKDSEWISDLLMNGLLKPSFVPSKEQRELREICAYRKSLVKTAAAERNRLQKILEGANIKLSGTVSNITGMSASNLLDLLEQGEVLDEAKYDELRDKKMISTRLKASKEQLIKDMNGQLTPTQSLMLSTVRKHIRELDSDIAMLDEEIEKLLSQDQKSACERIQMIPGISERSSQVIIAAIGTDMNQFPSAEHLASWAGLCPGNNESAGKKKNGRTNKGINF